MARSQEVRRERKRQRRAEGGRKQPAPRGSVGAPVDEEPIIVMVAGVRGEAVPSEITLPATRLSDSLCELMEPYIPTPWSRDELDVVETWLILVAQVWNLTVVDDPVERSRIFARLDRLGRTVGIEDDLPSIIDTIAAQKRRLFPTDVRMVVNAEITDDDGHATVRAAGAWYTR